MPPSAPPPTSHAQHIRSCLSSLEELANYATKELPPANLIPTGVREKFDDILAVFENLYDKLEILYHSFRTISRSEDTTLGCLPFVRDTEAKIVHEILCCIQSVKESLCSSTETVQMYLARINHAINQLYELSPILINSTHMTNSMDLIDVGTTQTTDHDMVDTKLTRFTSSWYEDFAHGFRTELVVSNPIEEREWEQLLLVELQELGSPGRNNGSLSACLDDHAKYEAVNHTKRLNVIYVLGEAVNLDLGRTERTILEYGKRLRSVGTNMDSSVVHFVQTHRDVQMGRGLAGLQANIRDDMALQGTIEIRLSTIDIFNVQANTYHDIIFVDPDSLQISTQPEEGSLFPVLEAEGLGTWNVHIRGISRFTKRETLWLAFSRFQNFIEVTVHEATERPGRDLVSATTSLPPETMTQERSSPGNGSSDERSATAVYHVKSSADRACSTMNGVRFDGAIINVYKEGPINSSYTSDRWGEDEIPVRPGDQSKGLNWNWFRDN